MARSAGTFLRDLRAPRFLLRRLRPWAASALTGATRWRACSARRSAAAFLAAAFSAAAIAASLTSNAALQRALERSARNADTIAIFPWTVRADLFVLLALALVIACAARASVQADATGPLTSWQRWLWPLTALALVAAAALLSPLAAGLTLALSLGVWWAVQRLAGARDRWLLAAAATAFALRVAVALGLTAYGLRSYGMAVVFDDERAYHEAAVELATILAAGTGDPDLDWRHIAGPQLDLIGLTYLLVGPDFTAIRLLNAALATLSLGLVFGTARALFGLPAARVATWLAAVWPMLAFWTGTGLRESPTILLTLLVPWLLTRTTPNGRVEKGLLVAAGTSLAMLVLASLRANVALALLAGLLVGVLAAPAPRALQWLKPAALLAALAGGIVLVGLSSGFESGRSNLADQLSPRALEYRAAAMQLTPGINRQDPATFPPKPDPSFLTLGSVVRVKLPNQDQLATAMPADYVEDPPRYVVLLGDGTRTVVEPEDVQPLTDANVGWADVLARGALGARLLFVLTPPWSPEPLQRRLSAPDTLAFDALLGLALLAAWRERRRRSATWLMLLVYPAAILVGLALLSTNLGTVVRQRSILVPWLAMLAAPLLATVLASVRAWRQPVALHPERRSRRASTSHASSSPRPVKPKNW